MGRMGNATGPAGPDSWPTERALSALTALEVPVAIRETIRAYDALRAEAKACGIPERTVTAAIAEVKREAAAIGRGVPWQVAEVRRRIIGG